MKQKFYYFLMAFFLIGFPFALFAQCSISGPSTIAVGSTAVYSVPSGLAQCSECYDWGINSTDLTTSGSVSIAGSDQNNTVSITAISAGTFTLKVTYFDETGCHVCTFSGAAASCDIPESEQSINYANDYGSPYLIFYTGTPIGLGGGTSFSYYWTFTYADNSTSNSTDEEPYFTIDCANPVKFATVVISSAICSKTVTKHWLPSICGTGDFGRKGQTSTSIKAFPNPASSAIKFEGKNLEKYTVAVADASGNYVIKSLLAANQLDISKLKSGVYMYLLTDKNGVSQKGKFIKK